MSDLATPDKNATGVSNAVPVDEIFKLADTLTPGIETFGLIYCPNEINSVTTINNAKKYMDEHGLNYKEAVVTSTADVAQATQSLIGDVDALFIPNDSVVQSAMIQVAEIAKDAQKPVYGSSSVMVASGALATVSIDDTALGAKAADLVDEFLRGTPISEIPAVVVDSFKTYINKTTADALGLTLDTSDSTIVFMQ